MKHDNDIEYNDRGVDLTAPPSKEFNDAERKLISFVLGVNAAMLQLVVEGVFPVAQQQHLMIHLQDFTARLYAGETLGFGPGMKVASAAGDAALRAVEEAILHGKVDIPEVRAIEPEEVDPDQSQKRTLN